MEPDCLHKRVVASVNHCNPTLDISFFARAQRNRNGGGARSRREEGVPQERRSANYYSNIICFGRPNTQSATFEQ